MRRCIATVSLSGMLREKLQAAAAARFDGVEIFENDLLQVPGTPREVRRIAEDLGLTIDLFQPFRDFDGVSPTQLLRNLERAERKFDVMQELGAPLILVCTNAQPSASGDIDLLAEQMHQLAERAALRGLRVGYEALAWAPKISRFGQAWQVVQKANHPHLGLVLDSFHTLALRDDPLPIADLPGEKIFFLQLADAPWIDTDVLSHSRHYRCFPGQGEFEMARFTAAVLDAGYTGPLSLEIFNDEFRAAPARPTAADAMRSLLWLEEQMRSVPSLKTGVPHGESRRVQLFDPPSPPQLQGWSFIEFAVDASHAERLSAFLRTIGFKHIGRHRSKAVDLYGQGEVRVVLNLEEDSFARAYFEAHGVSACATALATTDALAALGRAEALGCTRMAGRVGQNELNIPAVRAPDGSLLYFFDVHSGGEHGFEADFVLDEQPAADTAFGGQARIDHVVQVLPAGQVEPWTLFYRAVLGLQPTSSMVMNDPYGIIKSRVMESRDRAVRYALNVSERASTSTARTVSQFGGAGVQQIAVAVPDLVATARRLKALGASLLPVPGNYYDDLEAKYDIAPALLATLREFGIFYDRTADGELLQLYTTPFEDRFFFGLIERRGNYQDYGVANAPFHLAALAQFREHAQ
ncbi:MAG: 4-hydroxyphenylpyruvate dioxygenase [Rhodoferax sp.]|nr:4-hydroxyphenylpyruvate dioxygenase [Rhodoferax sp.]